MRSLALASLGLLLLPAPPLRAQPPGTAEALPSVALPPALDRVLRDYERAWRARDPAALAELFAEDGFVLASGQPPVRGRAAIRAAYAKGGGPLELRALAFAIEGSVGYIIGAYGHEPASGDAGKFVLALRKTGDGRWLIAADIDNSIRRPAAAPAAEEPHVHPAGDPSQLGRVSFPVSCTPAAQEKFNLAVAILHSFWYEESEKAFAEVLEADPQCTMAYWGIAMSLYHPLWEPPRDVPRVRALLDTARAMGARTDRERAFLDAIDVIYRDADTVPLPARARAWEKAHEQIHLRYPKDHEATIFYGLALLATAPPTDKTYANQIKAGALLEELLPEEPGHPGLAHYAIHAYDFPELALHGFAAAHAYAKIAPAVPHAQHMPSHIFTRLGDWPASIESNRAAARSAKEYAARLGVDAAYDELLHAMDYLEYAYLQIGEDAEARAVVDELAGIRKVFPENFKTGYAFAAIPARFVLERRAWGEAVGLTVHPGPFPPADAITHFARAYGLARAGRLADAQESIVRLEVVRRALAEKDEYWADQVEIQYRAASAWIAQAQGRTEEALRLARAAADQEDASAKHSVTPGPVVPARELLAELLLENGQPREALAEFEAVLKAAPNRLGAVYGAARSAMRVNDRERATLYCTQLTPRGTDGARPELREFLARSNLLRNEYER